MSFLGAMTGPRKEGIQPPPLLLCSHLAMKPAPGLVCEGLGWWHLKPFQLGPSLLHLPWPPLHSS